MFIIQELPEWDELDCPVYFGGYSHDPKHGMH